MSQIVKPPLPPPAEQPVAKIVGSPLTASADAVETKTAEQASAVQALGGKMAGGAAVEVKNIPQIPSAGNSNPSGVFAGMQELKATALEQGKYDDLGNQPAMKVGGKRRTRKHNKHGRNSSKHSRKRGGSSRRNRGVRHSSRRVRSHRGKKTHKK